MKFNAYNWDDYRLGYDDGLQDMSLNMRGISKHLRYNNERPDDAYFDGYVAGIEGLPSKDGSDVPCAYYKHWWTDGHPCKYRFMGNQWRLGVSVFAYVNRGDQLIGFAVYDEAEGCVLNLMEHDVSFNVSATAAPDADGGKGSGDG